MVKERSTEFAKASELLAPASGEKTVYLKTLKKRVKIKKVNIGELSEILKISKGSDVEQFILLTYKCLKEPHLKLDQVRQLPYQVLLELATEISKFSGLDEKSTREILNLLRTES